MQLQELQMWSHCAFQLMLHDTWALDQQLAHLLIAQPYLVLKEVQLIAYGGHSQLKQTIAAA